MQKIKTVNPSSDRKYSVNHDLQADTP